MNQNRDRDQKTLKIDLDSVVLFFYNSIQNFWMKGEFP